MVDRLHNKIALITGAGTGIGRAIAQAMLGEGARVSLVGRRKPLLEAVANQIGNRCVVIEADISKRPDVDRAIAQTVLLRRNHHAGQQCGSLAHGHRRAD
jgi:NADP-dependent 3-hydroxy acid dehydrogenase YdfG